MVRLLRDLWLIWQRPAVFRRCVVVAITVGTVLTLLNNLDALSGGRPDSALPWRLAANYLIPFVVSSFGALTALPPKR